MMPRDATAGTRIRLIECTDTCTYLPPGLTGTVSFVDDADTLHVDWDNGSKLGLIPGLDRWETLDA